MSICGPPWFPPPPNLKLSSDDVDVWRATLNQSLAHVHQFVQTLSDDERRRAERFRFEQDRRRFIVGRGILRTILGCYLNIEPDQLEFRYTPEGKPYLAEGRADPDLRFNLTHSEEFALFAFGRGREVGIDLERVRPDVEYEEIARRYFSQQETAFLMALPQRSRQIAFFTGWTRKEAYIKARGEGLSLPLGSFDVSLVPGKPAELLKVREKPPEVRRWLLRELNLGPGYIAALAVEGDGWRLACWDYPG
jgi:4'-phosphopantetheinyl transferase